MSARFYLDLVHPYCYLALPAVRSAQARGSEITILPWEKRPAPVALYEPRGDYLRTDWMQRVYRGALERNIEIHLPSAQPRSTLACAAYAGYRGPNRDELLDALFRAFFVDGLDVMDDRAIEQAAQVALVSVQEVWSSAYDPDVRRLLIAEREAAVAAGVTEIPALLVEGEPAVIGLEGVEQRLAQLR